MYCVFITWINQITVCSVQHLNEEIWDNCQTPTLRNTSDRKKQGPKSDKSKVGAKPDAAGIEKLEKLKKPKNGACVFVSGLAKSVKKKQIVHELFKECKITNYGLYMETQAGVCTGKCYVEFVDMEARDRAMKTINETKYYGKLITVTAISHDEMETKVRLHRKMLKQAEFLKRQAEKERRELKDGPDGESISEPATVDSTVPALPSSPLPIRKNSHESETEPMDHGSRSVRYSLRYSSHPFTQSVLAVANWAWSIVVLRRIF